jgi:hypothetical protein
MKKNNSRRYHDRYKFHELLHPRNVPFSGAIGQFIRPNGRNI